MTDYEKIRAFESGILDRFHTKCEFYKYTDDIVIPFLLQVFGDTERHSVGLVQQGYSEAQISFFLNNMVHGISHCIRWISEHREPVYTFLDDYNLARKISMDFITWGIDYNNVAQEFITWSRKFKDASIDEETKTITFSEPPDLDYSRLLGTQQRHWTQFHEPLDEELAVMIQRQFESWAKDIDLADPPLYTQVDWELAKNSPLFEGFYKRFERQLFPGLPEETNLDGYSLVDLRVFYTCFYINFYFIYSIELSIDQKRGVNNSLGSNPLYLSTGEFISMAERTTGLNSEIAAAIIKDFTFDTQAFRSRISVQPFILSSSGIYYVLPNLFVQIHSERMIAGVLNTTRKRKVYDRLINEIERKSLAAIGVSIAGYTRWKFFIGKTVKSGGRQFQPDIIIIDKFSLTVLVVEYKHYMAPIMAAEVVNRFSELNDALLRLEQYKEAVSNNTHVGNETIEGYNISGVLLTHRPLPVPIPQKAGSCITDSISFKDIISEMPLEQRLSDFITALRETEQQLVTEGFENRHMDTIVGEWTVRRNVRFKPLEAKLS